MLITAGAAQATQRVQAEDDATLELGVTVGAEVNENFTGFMQYLGAYSENVREHAVVGGLQVNF